MLNLFDQRQLLTLERTESVRLAVFGRIGSNKTNHGKDSNNNNYHHRCVLYTDHHRLLLCEIKADHNFEHLSIPVDCRKGHIVSMCLDVTSNHLLALTNQSIIYQLPFNIENRYDRHNHRERLVLQEEASVIDCRQWLTNGPSAICWWQRDRSMVVRHSSVAIVGNHLGQIWFVDLTTTAECHTGLVIKTMRVPSSIDKLQIFDEMYGTSLLVSCHDGSQYHLILEQFRSVLNHNNSVNDNRTSNCTETASGGPGGADSKLSTSTCSSSSTSNWTYLSCISIDAEVNRACDSRNVGRFKTSRHSDNSASDDESSRQPQLIRFMPDSITTTTTNQSSLGCEQELIANLDSILNGDIPLSDSKVPPPSSGSIHNQPHEEKICIYPQQISGQKHNILVVKQNRPNFDIQTDSDDSGSVSSGSNSFSNVRLYKDLTLDIYEFSSQDFATSSILLSSSRLFLVTVNNHIPVLDNLDNKDSDHQCGLQHKLYKIVDCGERFLLLLYRPNRCLLISKKFSEQRNSCSTSPRSPLLLNKKNSSSRSGSFRRKQQNQLMNGRTISVIEDFYLDDSQSESESGYSSVIDVFSMDIATSCGPQSTFTQEELAKLNNCTLVSPDCNNPSDNLDRVVQNELGAIELLTSEKMSNTVMIEEKFIVVTQHGLFLIHPKQTKFSELFHTKIESMLHSVLSGSSEDRSEDVDGLVEGDLITSAKFMVDCFVSRSRGRPAAPSVDCCSSQSYYSLQPYHSWQNWLQRSALLLLQQSVVTNQSPNSTNHLQQQILLLFELSRTPKRRLITALNHFGLHQLALFYCRKFFETKTIQELSDEERLYLSHQMFDSLLSNYLGSGSGSGWGHQSTSDSTQQLYYYFRVYRCYYRCRQLIDTLLDHRLIQMARFVAFANGNCVALVDLLLSKFFTDHCSSSKLSSLPSQDRDQILDLLTSPTMASWLILSTDYLDGVRHSVALIESYLNNFVLKQLASLSTRYLHRLAQVFDPSSLAMCLLYDSVLDNTNQTYLRTNVEHGTITCQLEECDQPNQNPGTILPIRKKDLLNLYLFVLLLCLRKSNAKLGKHCAAGQHRPKSHAELDKRSIYDWDFVKNVQRLVKSVSPSPNEVWSNISMNSNVVGSNTTSNSNVVGSNTTSNSNVVRSNTTSNSNVVGSNTTSNSNVVRSNTTSNSNVVGSNTTSNSNVVGSNTTSNSNVVWSNTTSNSNVVGSNTTSNSNVVGSNTTSNSNVVRSNTTSNSNVVRSNTTSNSNVVGSNTTSNSNVVRSNTTSNSNVVGSNTTSNSNVVRSNTTSNSNVVGSNTTSNSNVVWSNTTSNSNVVRSNTTPNSNVVWSNTTSNSNVVRSNTTPNSNVVRSNTTPNSNVVRSNTSTKSSNSTRQDLSGYRVCAGTYHSAAFFTGSDQLFVWGKFVHYNFIQLGISGSFSTKLRWSKSSHHLKVPTCVDFFSKVISDTVQIWSVASGHQHLLVLTNLGLFALGSSSFGQLGVGRDTLETRYPLLVEWFRTAQVTLTKVCCGSYHSFGLTGNGQLYSWGWALHGQLGHGSIEDEVEPRLVEYFSHNNLRVVDIAAGYAHSVVLTDQSTVFVFGENSYGQLGLGGLDSDLGQKSKLSLPHKVANLTSVSVIGCGLFHTVVVTDTNSKPDPNFCDDLPDYHQIHMNKLKQKVLCWGLDPKSLRVHMRSDRANQMYKMPATTTVIPDLTHSNVGRHPKSIHDYTKLREIGLERLNENEASSPEETVSILKISAGQCHTLLLTNNGHVYCFGSGREGQLGLGKSLLPLPDQLELIGELENIVDISCGAVHSLAVDADGAIWAFGQNSDYQLSSDEDCGTGQVLETGDTFRAASGRRNSLLGTLVKRDEQLMNRLMSMQKNVESSPIRIRINWDPKVNRSQSSDPWRQARSKAELTRLGGRPTPNYHSPRAIREMLLETLVRYRDDLDYRALLKRTDHFALPQLCSLISFGLSDYCLSFRYQLEALHHEISVRFGLVGILESFDHQDLDSVETLSERYLQQLCQLVTFFGNQSISNCGGDRQTCTIIYQLLQNLHSFLEKIDLIRQKDVVCRNPANSSQIKLLEKLTLGNVVEAVYLISDDLDNRKSTLRSVNNPYFGLNLLRLIDEQQKRKHPDNSYGVLDDRTMFRIVQRTEDLLKPDFRSTLEKSYSSNLTDIQELIEQLVDLDCLHRNSDCSSKSQQEKEKGSILTTTFPLEMAWQKIVQQFSPTVVVRDNDIQCSSTSNREEPFLEIELPELVDPELNENCFLFVFNCGHHYVGLKQLREDLDLVTTTTANRTEYAQLAELLSRPVSSSSIETSDLANLVSEMSCPRCSNLLQDDPNS